MKTNASFTISFGNESEAAAACKALAGETFKADRAISKVSQQGSKVLIMLEANDIVALRAATNSCLRHIQIIQNINNIGDVGEVDENGE